MDGLPTSWLDAALPRLAQDLLILPSFHALAWIVAAGVQMLGLPTMLWVVLVPVRSLWAAGTPQVSNRASSALDTRLGDHLYSMALRLHRRTSWKMRTPTHSMQTDALI
jgi:hypothetical protein